MLAHRNVATMGLGDFVDVDPIDVNDALVYAAPMSHGCGPYAIPHPMAGACHVIPASGGVDPGELFALGRVLVDHAETNGLTPGDAAAAFKTPNAIASSTRCPRTTAARC